MHDLICARQLVLPAHYPFCRLRRDGHSYLPVLADKGHIGAGSSIRVPHRRPSGKQVPKRTARRYSLFYADE